MVTFYPLSSGSSGNSYYLSAGEGQSGLLIDAGISARRIRTELCDAGIDPACAVSSSPTIMPTM